MAGLPSGQPSGIILSAAGGVHKIALFGSILPKK
jgi:hypothetical protein